MACQKMNQDVAYARNTESGCKDEMADGEDEQEAVEVDQKASESQKRDLYKEPSAAVFTDSPAIS